MLWFLIIMLIVCVWGFLHIGSLLACMVAVLFPAIAVGEYVGTALAKKLRQRNRSKAAQ